MGHWLMKSEPAEVSIDDLAAAKKQTIAWFGVRNYLARNYMREMKLRDRAFFYHSSCPEPGIAGIVEVSKLAYPDKSQFEAKGKYYDPKATKDNPRWFNVDVKLVEKTRLVSIAEMREASALADMVTLRKGNRLSITPVTAQEWSAVLQLLKAGR
ncbi:MAG: EVE domain-containing protein [Casimicrobiaceae bacterium]